MQIELKQISGYLPYELGFVNNENEYQLTINGLTDDLEVYNHGHGHFKFEDIKPILRPLSDLTKEIEVSGNKFIALLFLAGMAGTCSMNDFVIYGCQARHKTSKETTFELSSSNNSFVWRESKKWKDFGAVPRQLEMFQKLYEWHFDIHGLIEKDLAIDINTIKP